MQLLNITTWTWKPTLSLAKGLTVTTLTAVSLVLLKRLDFSNTQVTLTAALLYLPWMLLPWLRRLTDSWRTPRWWVIAMQLIAAGALAGIAFSIPAHQASWKVVLCLLLLSTASAIHDTASQAYCGRQARHSTLISQLIAQGLLVMLAGNMEVLTRSIRYSWSLVFYLMAGILILLWAYHHFVLPAPPASEVQHSQPHAVEGRRMLIPLYLLPYSLTLMMVTLFLIDMTHNGGMGLSPAEYGLIMGTVGVAGFAIGSSLGRKAVRRFGLDRCLWPMTLALTLPNVLLLYLAAERPDSLLVISLCLLLQQTGTAFGLQAYKQHLIYNTRAEDRDHHHVLATLTIAVPALITGTLQHKYGYQYYFLIVLAASLLPFVATYLYRHPRRK